MNSGEDYAKFEKEDFETFSDWMKSVRSLMQIRIIRTQWVNDDHRKVSFLTAPHCQSRGVGQGMKQIYLYLWYPLFQAQWNICEQRSFVMFVHVHYC